MAAVPSASDGRGLIPSSGIDLSASPPPEPLLVAPPTAPFPPSRDPSVTRGRASSASSPRNASPRGIASAAPGRVKQGTDLERKPSASYGHHRQTSIVNGVQHSRKHSGLASSTTSPLSPHTHLIPGVSDELSHPAASNNLKKSPSLSTIHSSNNNSSSSSNNNNNSNAAGGAAVPMNRGVEANRLQRTPERMHSGKVKRSHEPQRSQSRLQPQPPQEMKTVGEYAMHHLFTSFIAEADERIERCMRHKGEREPRVEDVCGPGADASFDQLISSLGHINRFKPNSLIDSVIHWRKKKADHANQMMTEMNTRRDGPTPIPRTALNGTMSAPTSPSSGQEASLEHEIIMAERRSAISIYILCRVLIDVLGQTTVKALNGPDNVHNTAARLEDVIYNQLHGVEPDSVATLPLRRTNWVIRGQVLGVMSNLRFAEVVERFIQDLDKAQRKLSVKGIVDQKLVTKTAMLVQSMRWLKIKCQPDDAWTQSCDMLHVLAKFFNDVHGKTMKHAYAELFESLLLPIAGTATGELNNAKWREVLSILQPKISSLVSKADHWPHVFPLQAVLLCVSPTDNFATQWLSLATSFQPKNKDRASWSHALKAICRLVWRFLYRQNESQNNQMKKLDEIVKLVFQGGRRALISTDPSIADPLIQLIRIIGFKQPDLCFRSIMFPLMSSELFSSVEKAHEANFESLDPERTAIAIRSVLAVMTDLEKGERPPFPTSFECDQLMDPASRSPITHRRTKSQPSTVLVGRTERLSRPVMTQTLDDVTKEHFSKFCQILQEIVRICDVTFGGKKALEEKVAAHTPKTPMAEAFMFTRKDSDMTGPTDLRQNYYDLLHVAVEALPRCLSPNVQIPKSQVNLLCNGTAHVQPHIASCSIQSLKSIARQSHAQQVTIAFARFIFDFDDQYATVSDGGLLGPGHIESTLKLYVELLQIWIDEIQLRTSRAVMDPSAELEQPALPLPLDLSAILAHVDEVESHGLFFLCSPSRAVRAIAVNVLRLITKFDIAFGKPATRIIGILEGSSDRVIDVNDERLSLAEKGLLQKGLRKDNLASDSNSTLVELCSSDIAHDANLWFKIFPNLVRLSAEICIHPVALTRELICQRLGQSQKLIEQLADPARHIPNGSHDAGFGNNKPGGRFNTASPETAIELWKIHLIFACTTLTNIGSNTSVSSKPGQASQHIRKSSKSSSTSAENMSSALELFNNVKKFLHAQNPAVRNAVVLGLGTTNATLFQTLLGCLHQYIELCNSDAKNHLASHQRSVSSPRRNYTTEPLRTEITRLFSLTCHHLKDPAILADDFALPYMLEYAKQLRLYLSDAEIQHRLEFQKLRTYFCNFVETLYDASRQQKDASHWMSFQSRQATFALIENWCGHSPNESALQSREETLRRSILDLTQDAKRSVINSAFEKEKNELQNAALSCMAALCAGPLNFVADGRILMQFDIRRMLAWINSIFETPSDRIQAIGRKALQNLIVHNLDHTYLMAQAIRMCYIAKQAKALSSYFEVVTRVLRDIPNAPTPFWKILCAGLYTLGNEDTAVRMKSIHLLRTLEERQSRTSKLQDLDVSVSDKTTAVYKLAQFEVSRRLAKQHPELAFHVFSEFSAYFNELGPDHQRNMVSGMLPWIQTIELQLDPNGGPTASSYMLLVNMFEITVKSSITLHNEVLALWQALATGPYAGNVQLVLDFITTVCIDKREQNFVSYAKQIVVFLSKTPAGARVVEYLLLQIHPKTMVAERREPMQAPTDTTGLPYVADLAAVLPTGAKQGGLSLGQLSMILLVDLVVSPFSLPADKLPTLLQVILVQWDQHHSVVQDQAREMLVHLIHELVISKIEPGATEPDKKSIEDFIECVRRHNPKTVWIYMNSDGKPKISNNSNNSRVVPESMAYVVDEVVKIFSLTYPGLREDWGKTTMTWATSCAVRHVACRSFQLFRCISTNANQQMLADMLARLSNTISDDENHDYLLFSLEILITLRSIIDTLTPLDLLSYPQLFWTTCACLDTIFEDEFEEGLAMLGHILRKMDLSDPAVLKILRESKPTKWEGGFEGLQAMLYKGVRSSKLMETTLQLMERLLKIPSCDIIGGDERFLFTLLANLPRYLHFFDIEGKNPQCLESAETLAHAAECQRYTNLAKILQGFARSKYRDGKDFLAHCVSAFKTTFYPSQEFQSLVFLLGMVNNQWSWVKVRTMQVLCVVIPEVDMRKPEIATQGPDLISPLLRLLQTEHCQQALGVLDNVIDLTGTPLDNKHLRMSMAGSHSSRATRKEYESTESLYGIPEASGWSIPMPAIHAAHTRANVHAVFYTLTYVKSQGEEFSAAKTPEIEFDKDDLNESYFSDRTATMASDDTKTDGNMGDLAMKLDSLDDFFDEEADTPSPLESTPGGRKYSHGLVEERENLYDQQALPILHKSMQRNASITSFQHGFAEIRYQPPKEPSTMNPGAFAAVPGMLSRPGMHNRSITSPAVSTKQMVSKLQTTDLNSSDERDLLSDDDASIGRSQTADETHRVALGQNTVKPAGFAAGFRQGLRRLTSTSGSRENREALRMASGGAGRDKGPKVPKVPATYVRDPIPASAEP